MVYVKRYAGFSLISLVLLGIGYFVGITTAHAKSTQPTLTIQSGRFQPLLNGKVLDSKTGKICDPEATPMNPPPPPGFTEDENGVPVCDLIGDK